MSLFDIILLAIIGGFGLFGLWFGLIHTFGSLAGTILGVFLASRYFEPVANWLINITGWRENVAKVIIFVLAFIIINRLVGLCFWLMEKMLKIVIHLPFLRSLDKILGMVFGLIEGIAVLSIAMYFIARFPVGGWLMDGMATSKILPFFTRLADIFVPLLPEAIKTMKSALDGVI